MRTRPSKAYTLFDTAIGKCAIAWSDSGITQIQLPEKSAQATVDKLCVDTAGDTSKHPRFVAEAIRLVKCHLDGQMQDFHSIPLDLEGLPPFHRKVYEALRQVPAGATVSYGQLARQAGSPNGSRAVGQAMAKNPIPIIVPCHRVLASAGKIGGFSAFGGLSLKEKLLTLEAQKAGKKVLCRA